MLAACVTILESYTPRSPRKSQYYRCVEAHFEELERTWDSRYQKQYGYWRPHVLDVIYKYLDCGDLHQGFARVKCNDCNHEYLLPFSCKRRSFCPTCHQKRVVEFGEHLHEEVLEDVAHRQWVFSLPKRLRPYFMYDRKLLPKLSLCAWNVLSEYLKTSISKENSADKQAAGKACCSSMQPGCVIAVQTFGEFLNFNPHLHFIASDGCFHDDRRFIKGALPVAADLEQAFAAEVFNMLIKEEKISLSVVDNMNSWQHSGFNVYCGQAVSPFDDEGIEKLSQYIVRAPFSQERMIYIPEHDSADRKAMVIYEGKTSKLSETFTALDFLARLVTHIPGRGEQMVRYYGFYSNKSRGMRKKEEQEKQDGNNPDSVQVIVDSNIGRKKFRKNWARLIQKIYHVNPLLCPKCNGEMRIISFIEDEAAIKKILIHLNLWLPDNHDPPPGSIMLQVQPHRSFEWWEAVNQVSDFEYVDDSMQKPYEDDFFTADTL